jgi:hypothetical protein
MKDILINAADFVDEVIPIYQAELEDRTGPIQTFLQTCAAESGEVRHRISVTNFIDRTNHIKRWTLDGTLILSTTGVGFLAEEITNLGTSQETAPMVDHGGIGPIASMILSTVDDQLTPDFPIQDLPSVLLARLFDTAAWYSRDQVDRVTHSDGRLLEFHGTRGVVGWGLYTGDMAPLETWCRDQEMDLDQFKSKGFLGSLQARFRKK